MSGLIKVGGLWELSWNVPLNESWLWSFPLREFGVKDWAMTPVTGILHNERFAGMVLTEYNSPKEMVEQFGTDCVRVFVDEKGDTDLNNLVHPENAVYFFGCAGNAPTGYKQEGDLTVKIPTVANSGVMWPHQCLVAVLYDRLVKSWQSS